MVGRQLNPTEIDAYDLLPGAVAERVRVHRIRALPGGYSGLTLGRHIIVAREVSTDGTSTLLAHELVHVRQWTDQGTVGFAARYTRSFLGNLIRLRRWGSAYRAIPAEEEARRETTDWLRRQTRGQTVGEGGEDGQAGSTSTG